uniref:Uncharacterized protein n=1 Tax=Arundo donax TaxID=35708 RepID=A0A0A9H498_ARUDO
MTLDQVVINHPRPLMYPRYYHRLVQMERNCFCMTVSCLNTRW